MNFDEDDPLVFPWEEGAPAQPRTQVNFGLPSNNPARPSGRKTRRSSILKQPSLDSGSDRAALQDIGNSPKKKRSPKRASLSRRVSFSTANFVKEFCTGKDELTVWNSTYEEEREHSDSSSAAAVNRSEQDMEMTCNVAGKSFSKNGDAGDLSSMEMTLVPGRSVYSVRQMDTSEVEMDLTRQQNMDLTCMTTKSMDITTCQNSKKSVDLDATDMEMTCQVARMQEDMDTTYFHDISTSDTPVQTTEMEMTCSTDKIPTKPVFQPSPAKDQDSILEFQPTSLFLMGLTKKLSSPEFKTLTPDPVTDVEKKTDLILENKFEKPEEQKIVAQRESVSVGKSKMQDDVGDLLSMEMTLVPGRSVYSVGQMDTSEVEMDLTRQPNMDSTCMTTKNMDMTTCQNSKKSKDLGATGMEMTCQVAIMQEDMDMSYCQDVSTSDTPVQTTEMEMTCSTDKIPTKPVFQPSPAKDKDSILESQPASLFLMGLNKKSSPPEFETLTLDPVTDIEKKPDSVLENKFEKPEEQKIVAKRDPVFVGKSKTQDDDGDLVSMEMMLVPGRSVYSIGQMDTSEVEMDLMRQQNMNLTCMDMTTCQNSKKNKDLDATGMEMTCQVASMQEDMDTTHFHDVSTSDTPFRTTEIEMTSSTDKISTKPVFQPSPAKDQDSILEFQPISLFQIGLTKKSLAPEFQTLTPDPVTDVEKKADSILANKFEKPEEQKIVAKRDLVSVVESKTQVIATSSKPKHSHEAKKSKNIREISVFNYLFEKQSEIEEIEDSHVHGRFSIVEVDLVDGRIKLGFVRNSLELNIRLGHPLPSEEVEDALSDRTRTLVKHWTIRAMEFENPSRLQRSKNGDKCAKLAQFLLLRQLKSSWFQAICPTTCSLKETLNKVSAYVHESVRFVLDMYEIQFSHSHLSVNDDYQVTVGFYNTKLHFSFFVDIDFSKGFSSAKSSDNIVVRHQPSLFKNVKTDSIMQLVKASPAGWRFLKIFVGYVDTYCNELSKSNDS